MQQIFCWSVPITTNIFQNISPGAPAIPHTCTPLYTIVHHTRTGNVWHFTFNQHLLSFSYTAAVVMVYVLSTPLTIYDPVTAAAAACSPTINPSLFMNTDPPPPPPPSLFLLNISSASGSVLVSLPLSRIPAKMELFFPTGLLSLILCVHGISGGRSSAHTDIFPAIFSPSSPLVCSRT